MPGVVSIGGVGTSKLRIAMRNGGAVGGKHQRQPTPDQKARDAHLRGLAERISSKSKRAPAQADSRQDKTRDQT